MGISHPPAPTDRLWKVNAKSLVSHEHGMLQQGIQVKRLGEVSMVIVQVRTERATHSLRN